MIVNIIIFIVGIIYRMIFMKKICKCICVRYVRLKRILGRMHLAAEFVKLSTSDR